MCTSTRKKKLDYKQLISNNIDNYFTTSESWRNQSSEKKPKEFLKKKRTKNLNISSKAQSSKERELRIQRVKNLEKENQINKDEYNAFLSEYSEEMKAIGIDTNEEKVETSSFISDMNSLYFNLFFYTKFENSKPYKMIDYIINNDQYLINRPIDKERFEEMKKGVFAKNKSTKDDNLSVVFKTLYEYFRTDFSNSIFEKLFIKINEILQSFNNNNNSSTINSNINNNTTTITTAAATMISNQVKNDDMISINQQEKKDKFTYSNFLFERLKHKSSASLIEYTNDKEFIKSLMYLNNKSNKHLNKKNKLEKKLLNAFRENADVFNSLSKQSLNSSEIKFMKGIIQNKRLHKFLDKKFNSIINCIDEIKESQMDERQFVKFIEIIYKNKEDECEKLCKDFKGDTKTLWICIKFIFYLHMLSKKDKTVYYTDNNFWKIIISFLNDKRIELNPFLINKDKDIAKAPQKLSKGRKKDSTKKREGKSSDNIIHFYSEKNEGNGKEKIISSPMNTSVKEKDVEMENFNHPMEDIKKAILLKYDNEEDIFTFMKEEKKNKKKEKDKVKEKNKVKNEEKEQDESKDLNYKENEAEDKEQQKDDDQEMNTKDKDEKRTEFAIEKEQTKENNPKPKRKRKPRIKDNDNNKEKEHDDSKEKDIESKEKRKRKPRKAKEESLSSQHLKICINNINLLDTLSNENLIDVQTSNNLLRNKKNNNEDNKSQFSQKTITSKTETEEDFNTFIKIPQSISQQPNFSQQDHSISIIDNPMNEVNHTSIPIIKIPITKEGGLFSISNLNTLAPSKTKTKVRSKPSNDSDCPKKPIGRPRKATNNTNKLSKPVDEINPLISNEYISELFHESIREELNDPYNITLLNNPK